MAQDSDLQELHRWMGFALHMIQAAEHALADALAIVFPPAGMISVDSLDAAEEMERRKTLGGLLTELRRSCAIRQGFEEILAEFLSARNEFVHRFTRAFELGTPEGRRAGIESCQKVGGQAELVARTFMGASFAQYQYIAETTGAPIAVDWESMPKSVQHDIGLGIIIARTRLGNWQGSA